jgi:hypothetical protein
LRASCRRCYFAHGRGTWCAALVRRSTHEKGNLCRRRHTLARRNPDAATTPLTRRAQLRVHLRSLLKTATRSVRTLILRRCPAAPVKHPPRACGAAPLGCLGCCKRQQLQAWGNRRWGCGPVAGMVLCSWGSSAARWRPPLVAPHAIHSWRGCGQPRALQVSWTVGAPGCPQRRPASKLCMPLRAAQAGSAPVALRQRAPSTAQPGCRPARRQGTNCLPSLVPMQPPRQAASTAQQHPPRAVHWVGQAPAGCTYLRLHGWPQSAPRAPGMRHGACGRSAALLLSPRCQEPTWQRERTAPSCWAAPWR